MREPDTGWFCFFYSFTFGGFVGLASFLTIFFHDQYLLSKVRAGDFTTIVVVAGSFLRPVGGWLADKIGGYRLLLMLLSGAACCLAGVGTLPSLPVVVVLLFLTMGMLGMGNGAAFQLVPQHFSQRMGVLTGLVGAAGGLGGFVRPRFWARQKIGPDSTAWGCSFSRRRFLQRRSFCSSWAACGALRGVRPQWNARESSATVRSPGIWPAAKTDPAQRVKTTVGVLEQLSLALCQPV